MRPFLKAFLASASGATGVNLLLLFILRPLVINPAMPLQALSPGPVVTLTLMGVIAATIVYGVMRRTLRNPARPFVWVSLAVLLISLVPDFQIIGVTTGRFAGGSVGSAVALMIMHVAAAAVIVASCIGIWGAERHA